jgi:excisionase family DNA binding protein
LRGLPNFAQLKRALALPHKLQLNCREAAMLAGESEDTLRAAIKSRKLRARWAGNRWKIKRADLEAWVKRL